MPSAVNNAWYEANQRFLLAEFAQLEARLKGEAGSQAGVLEEARAQLAAPAAIDGLAALFGLSDFERSLLLLCAAVEMQAEIATLCAAAGNVQRREATFGLALGALEGAHWSALTPAAPLRRWRLVEPDGSAPLTTAPLRIDERILHYIAGINALDARLRPYVLQRPAAGEIARQHAQLVDTIAGTLQHEREQPTVVVLSGDDPRGREDVAARVAERFGLFLYELAAADVPTAVAELESLQALWSRETCLMPAALLLRCEAGLPDAAARFIESVAGLAFVSCRDTCRLRRPSRAFAVDKPEPAEQKRLWTHALGPAAPQLNGTLDLLASQFRLGAQSIQQVVTQVGTQAPDGMARGQALVRACRAISRERLDDLAQRLDTAAEWDDLVLPQSEKATLRQISAQVRHRLEVYDTWGYAARCGSGLGITALFCGDSGTGKTLAAQVMAHELALDLYRVDLSAVVSKYIGETEKNLKRVFDAAEDSGAVLLFDEADALFGKRSDVKDSHDRYANIEVGYLLQRMESYRGLAILTTNMRSALDKSFLRRLRFVVQFPFPDARQREEIWRRSIPARAPTRDIDHRRLAQVNLAGGNIRNIALNAAFLAAEENTPLCMSHLLQAARHEAQKIERPLTDCEVRGWV
jgi:ATPase family associated with various cellular activities (AAA)/Winged helix domain, variant